ncbi:MAG: hypothetical protein ACXWDI_14015, partial [Nocardioides sp.]
RNAAPPLRPGARDPRYDQHPIYDTLYVAVAERLGQRLVTADRALASRVARLGFVTSLPQE